MELSKEDITAIKLADRVCFRLTKSGQHPLASRAAGEISLIKENENDAVFNSGGRDSERVISVDGSLPGWARKAFAMRWVYRPAGSWTAFVALVRVGDEIHLSARENGNDYVKAAMIPAGKLSPADTGYSEIHCDEMVLTVRRKGKTILQEMTIVSSICPDNSARMIQ